MRVRTSLAACALTAAAVVAGAAAPAFADGGPQSHARQAIQETQKLEHNAVASAMKMDALGVAASMK